MIIKITCVLFLLTVFSLPLVNATYISFLGQKILLTDILFLVTALFFVIGVVTRRFKLRTSSFYLPLALYSAALLLSTVFSSNFRISSVKFLGVLYLVGLAIITFNVVKTERMSKLVCSVWLAATFLAAFMTVLSVGFFYLVESNFILDNTLSHYGSLPPGNYPRIHSTFFNANMFCNYLCVSWLVLLVSYRIGWVSKWMFYILVAAFSIASVFTISPGLGGIALGVGLWLWLSYSSRGNVKKARMSLVFGGIIAVIFLSAVTFSLDFTSGTNIEGSVRTRLWESSITNILENPILGRGLGVNSAEVYFKSPDGNEQFLTDAHQTWLNVAAQSGIVGLIAIIILGISVLRRGMPLSFDNDSDVLISGLIIAFVAGFFYSGLTGSFEDARHLWVLIGFIGAITEPNYLAKSSLTRF